jgi:ATP-binding cassette subfamily F protein 3
VIEVRDGRARNYGRDYDAYLHAVNKEIDDGEREEKARQAKMASPPAGKTPKQSRQNTGRDHRKIRKEITAIERKIARLDEQKNELNAQMLATTDADEALRLHNEVAALASELAEAEDRWCELQEEIGETEFTT